MGIPSRTQDRLAHDRQAGRLRYLAVPRGKLEEPTANDSSWNWPREDVGMAERDEPVLRLWSDDVITTTALLDVFAEMGLDVHLEESSVRTEMYVDTTDWWLYRAGAICRLCTNGGKATLSIESLHPNNHHTRSSSESVESSHKFVQGSFPQALRAGLPDELKDAMGQAALDVRLRLRRKHSVYRISGPNSLEFEAVADTVSFAKDVPSGPFAEVTLRLLRGSPNRLDPVSKKLSTNLRMKPVDSPTLCRGLQIAGIVPPGLVEGDDLILKPDDRFVDSAYRVLRRHFNRMAWNEPGTRLGLDPEFLHDMRVATRRIRAALRVFRPGLPPRRVQGLVRDLRWLGRTLGEVRDLDVYLIRLQQEIGDLPGDLQPGVEHFRKLLIKRREKARQRMLQVLDSRRYDKFIFRFRRFLDLGPPNYPTASKAKIPVGEVAGGIIKKRLRKVLRTGREIKKTSPDEQLHRLRIDCKRLRYVCEFFADIYGGAASKFARRVTKIQDILGVHQDAVVARSALSSFAGEISPPAGQREKVFMALGHLMAQHEGHARACRSEFAKVWKRFDRKKVRGTLLTRVKKFL